MNLVELLESYKSIAIIGLGKNVGKTTVLNYLIREFHARRFALALTSIGRDGEEIDVVTLKEKPRIFAPKNTIIITTEGLLALSQVKYETLLKTDFFTPMGPCAVLRTSSSGLVQLGGPSIVAHMAEILAKIEGFGVDKILIDGAVGRKSLAGLGQAAVLCTGAAIGGNMDDVIAQTRHASEMLTLPKAPATGGCVSLNGAVSDRRILELINSGANLKDKLIVAENPTKIFISPSTYAKLKIKGASLAVKTPLNLVAITTNPTTPTGANFNPAEFLAKMREALKIPVFNILKE
ncbi:MAG: hypothetical protein LBE35_05790 [Clostridiales bacterium]|jgi:hypothetical protein|nr:hypothetical protein [Clostridiales bacterium]